MDLYQDQISVLLGHNGAGKTTTISMITGFLKPTRGTAIVNGYDITKNLSQARSSLGLCPQHDILFNKLTCKDHLAFFLRLRGQYHATSKYEIEDMLSKVGLAQKMSSYAINLSGGQRRKLSVACAFIGNNKTVFLDEPSSGLDPSARRELWDFLKDMRHGRTILLTTHYMDEADILGDRIMIMAEGVVKCSGTPMFLKQIYGTGYQMNIVKTEKCFSRTVTALVRQHITNAKFTGETPNEIYYLLPDEKVYLLPKLFAELEKKKNYLNISSFGITATSMEDVFIRVGEGQEPKTYIFHEPEKPETSDVMSVIKDNDSHFSERLDLVRKSVGTKLDDADELESQMRSSIEQERKSQDLARFDAIRNYKKNQGRTLFTQQMKAIVIKRLILFKRSLGSAVILLLLPVGLTMLGASYDMTAEEDEGSPAIYFSLDGFKDLIVPIFRTSRNNVIGQIYKNQFSTSPGVTFVESNKTSTDDINEYLINWGKSNGKKMYERKMIVGAVFEEEHYTILYQKSAVHAKGISTQLLMNTWVQSMLGNDFSIQLGVHHRPPTPMLKKSELQLATMFCLGFAMAMVPVVYIHSLIAERSMGAKHLQSLSGVSPMAYWLGAYIFDMFFFIIIIATVMLGLTINPSLYLARGRWAVTLLMLVSFAMAMFPYLYAVQIIFKNPANGVLSILCFNVFVGVLVAVTLAAYKVMNVEYSLLHRVDMLLAPMSPNYVLTTCQFFFVIISIQKYSIDDSFTSYLTSDVAGETLQSKLLLFAIHFVGGWVFVALVEFRVDRLLWYLLCGKSIPLNMINPNHPGDGHLAEDGDVQEESRRVNETPVEILCQNNAIVLKNLRKIFCVKFSLSPFVAVHNSSLALPQNECLGLLGQNGAGKTTTFKMLTGDHMVSSGDAYVKGLSVKTQIKTIQAMMGYCPQQDALHERLTGRETLYLYARLRGVPETSLHNVTEAIVDFVTLRPHEDKLTGKYSGGNKRKLSVGISIIGDPLFIMLDEPTAGMDPVAKRTLWTVLHLIRSSGRTLVLTSHSMEECEALCTRIAIMAKGRILCLGSPQHLKNKYGQGYTVVIRASVDEHGKVLKLDEAHKFVVHALQKSQVFATQEAYVHLQVSDSVPLSILFSTLEQAKQKYKFQFYTVQQTTLEQVFLMFMKETFV